MIDAKRRDSRNAAAVSMPGLTLRHSIANLPPAASLTASKECTVLAREKPAGHVSGAPAGLAASKMSLNLGLDATIFSSAACVLLPSLIHETVQRGCLVAASTVCALNLAA